MEVYMFYKEITKSVVVWGLGINSVKFTYWLAQHGIEVKYYLTNDKCTDTFCNRPVYELGNNSESINKFIVIATSMDTYSVIARQLMELGLMEFQNFIYWEWIFKKLVLVHGNCHTTIIKELLASSKEFNEQYSFYPLPSICLIENYKINSNIFMHIDVWIHQNIRTENKYGYYVSDEYIRQCIRNVHRENEIRDITIPNLYNLGQAFFPQICKTNKYNAFIDAKEHLLFPLGDVLIDRCVEKGMSVLEILEFYKSDMAYTPNEILELFEKCMNKIKEREKEWDIKIHDYIAENYQKTPIFNDPYHPTNNILKIISVEILKLLNITEDALFAQSELNKCEIPILPCVREALGITYDNSLIRLGNSTRKLTDYVNLDSYVRQYLWWSHNKI